MTGIEQTMALVQYFMNNCCFDRNGKSYCNRQHDKDQQ